MRNGNEIAGIQTYFLGRVSPLFSMLLSMTCLTLLSTLVFVESGYAANPSAERSGTESAFDQAAPSSVLIVPVVNHSLDVDAPNYMLSTLTIPLAERGYYVFPVNTIKIVLEQEGFYEPDMVHSEDPVALAALFGADAVLYVTINRWDAQYIVFSTQVTVDFSYRMVSSAGQEIWTANKTMQYTPQRNNSSGSPLADLLASAIVAAIDNAAPKYMSLTEKANDAVFRRGYQKIPTGPYYGKKR